MSKFEFELLEDSDEGAHADDEETDEDCEIENILVGEMPEDEIRRRCEQSGKGKLGRDEVIQRIEDERRTAGAVPRTFGYPQGR